MAEDKSAVNYFYVKDPDYNADVGLNIRSNDGPTSFVIHLGNRPALTLRRDGDTITAVYDPADLDAAAQVFVDTVTRLLGVAGNPQ